jgi:hypothetical protein
VDLHGVRSQLEAGTTAMSTRRYLDRVFGSVDDGYVELRSAPSGQREWTTPGNWTRFGAFITAAVRRRENVYCGLATRRSTADGTEANLQELPGLFLDIDRSPALVRPLLEGFPFPPAFIVSSGFGTHATWLFKEPLDVSTPAGIQRAAPLCRRAAAYFQADDRATNPAVAPRLVGSKNFKYAVPQPVTLLEERDATLNVCELEDFLPREVIDRKRNAMTIGASIPVGDRHNQLFALTRSMLCNNIPFDAVSLAVHAVNDHVCAKPLPESELSILLHDALLRPHRHGFEISTPHRLVLHDLPDATLEDELPPLVVEAEKEKTRPRVTADQLVAELVAGHPVEPLCGTVARQAAQAAGIPERTFRTALRRAGLSPIYSGRGTARHVIWQIDTRHEEIA